MPKGELCKPNNYYAKMVFFLRRVGDQPFLASQMSAKTHVPWNVLTTFLWRKTLNGTLSRSGVCVHHVGYTYHVVKRPVLYASNGAVADAVWKLIINSTVPLKVRDIWLGVNMKKTRKFLRGSVHRVILCLRKKGAIIKTEQGYIWNPEFKERPIMFRC